MACGTAKQKLFLIKKNNSKGIHSQGGTHNTVRFISRSLTRFPQKYQKNPLMQEKGKGNTGKYDQALCPS